MPLWSRYCSRTIVGVDTGRPDRAVSGARPLTPTPAAPFRRRCRPTSAASASPSDSSSLVFDGIVAVGAGGFGPFDGCDASRQVRSHRGGPHFQRRTSVAVTVLVLAGVHVSNNDDRVTLPERGADALHQPVAPAVDRDVQRVAGLPVALGGAPPRIAGHPELVDLLVADPAADRIRDDGADYGERCLEHCSSFRFMWLLPYDTIDPVPGRRSPRRRGRAQAKAVDESRTVDDRRRADEGVVRSNARLGIAMSRTLTQVRRPVAR